MERIRHIPDIEYETALLQYIRMNADIQPFFHATGNDIVRLNRTIDNLMAAGHVCSSGNKLSITDKGEIYHKTLNKILGRRGIYAFLLPEYSVRKEALKITDVYIPEFMLKKGGSHFSYSYVSGRSGESSGDKGSLFEHDK